MVSTSDFRKGLKIDYKNNPFEIIDFQHVKIGRGGAVMRTKLKNLKTGVVLEDTFRSGEKFDTPQMEEKDMQYLYCQDTLHYFMDIQSYEQISLTESQFGETKKFIKENINVKILNYKDKPISVEPPMFVELRVVDTEPSFKGDTASGSTKPAKMETGLMVKVPFHIVVGDILKIDTRSSEYIEKIR